MNVVNHLQNEQTYSCNFWFYFRDDGCELFFIQTVKPLRVFLCFNIFLVDIEIVHLEQVSGIKFH